MDKDWHILKIENSIKLLRIMFEEVGKANIRHLEVCTNNNILILVKMETHFNLTSSFAYCL